MGIPVYMPSSVKEKYPQSNAICVEEMKNYKIGFANIVPFKVPHDCLCYGYYIKADNQKIVWMTDLEYCPMNFSKQKVNTIIVEANYDKSLLDMQDEKAKRVYQTHMEIGTTCDFIKANKSPELRNIFLCHLSAENASGTDFVSKVKEIVECEVKVCHRGLCESIDLLPF